MITTDNYKTLDDAYSYFNKKLFDDKLPDCIITFQRQSRTLGYYHHEKFEERDAKNKISEIALNPDHFKEQTDMDILDTLVHEMVHLLQWYFGEPSRKGYHNKEWGTMMKSIGLYPSSTGEPGGKETGQTVSDYVISGGKFEIVCGAFLLKNSLKWNSLPVVKVLKDEVKNKTREKYCCPKCFLNVWGKKNIKIICGECKIKMEIEKENDW